jgi:glycosyltransferase involved in cell wall biosynthesis
VSVEERVDASVVIPTRDRPASLARCLAALDGQVLDDALEIVVVDDGSRDLALVVEVVEASPRAKLVRNEGKGPAAARNCGAGEARGQTLLFVDDDCEPSPHWASSLIGPLATGADAAAGRTVNARPEDRLAEASQTIANYLHDWSTRTDGRAIFAASNNLACSAEAFRRVRFDEQFPVAGGEDRDWCARFAEAGLTLVAQPSAVVAHRQALSFTRFLRQQVNYGRGAYLFRRGQGSAWRLAPPGFYRGLLTSAFQRGATVGSLVLLAQFATGAGYILAALTPGRRRGSR